MRQGQNSKRSRGRGSGRRNNVPARHQTFDSNGPSVRIRGSANQVHEKYLTMARDAASAGDRIAAENYLQHAEHYFRIINVDNDGDGRGRGDAQRANRLQQESQSEGDGDAKAGVEDAVVVEAKTPPPGNGTGNEEIGEGSEQPARRVRHGAAGVPRAHRTVRATVKPGRLNQRTNRARLSSHDRHPRPWPVSDQSPSKALVRFFFKVLVNGDVVAVRVLDPELLATVWLDTEIVIDLGALAPLPPPLL
jgi:hypothetical protein